MTLALPKKLFLPVELISDIGVDYEPLEQLLLEQKWREADRKTAAILLKILNREIEGWLRLRDIKKIPCRDLRTIDQLWVKLSNGRFGFSVQKRIWERIGGNTHATNKTWKRFGKSVGWYVETSDPISQLWSNWRKYIRWNNDWKFDYWDYDHIIDYIDDSDSPFPCFLLENIFIRVYNIVAIFPIKLLFELLIMNMINLLIFLVRITFAIFSFPIYVIFSLFLFCSQKFWFQKGSFPTIIKPGKGILMGKGAKVALIDMQEDMRLQDQVVNRASESYKRIEQNSDAYQMEANRWGQRAQNAMAQGEEYLAQEALEMQENYTEQANLLQSSLDERREELKSKKRKFRILKRKVSYVSLEILYWEISCLSSKLGECDIS